jgi:peptidoglycan/LPS O-acetylase OafA/YrhL
VTGARVIDSADRHGPHGEPPLADVSTGHSPGLPILPAFDGLRGIAVLLVLAFHFGAFVVPDLHPWPVRGGFLGVDFFFVLSGFLITTILLAELQRSGRIRLKRFYLRRVTRLVPALVGLLVAHWIYALIEGWPLHPERVATLYALTFSTNWAPAHGVYLSGDVPLDLNHLWSLAVEGQFYLVWPFVLWGLFRWARPEHMVGALIALIAVVVVVRPFEVHIYDEPMFVYRRFETRADALLVGALIAVLYARTRLPSQSTRRWVAVVGALALAVAIGRARPDASVMYWGGFTAIGLSVAAILSVTLERQSRLAAALSWPPIRSVGLASYSIYLWHLPVFIWSVRTIHAGVARVVLALSVTALMSTLSYWLLERPYMSRRGRLVPSRSSPGRKAALASASGGGARGPARAPSRAESGSG